MKIEEKDVESMIEAKESAKRLIDNSDCFMLVTIDGATVHSSRGYYHNRDKLALVGAMDLIALTMQMESLSRSNVQFVPHEVVTVN